MEIDITSFVMGAGPSEYFGSIAERGPNAAKETWGNALGRALVPPPMLADGEALQAFRDHMRGFGAWDDDEISAWSDQECNALFIQIVSGDMREMGLGACAADEFDWEAYRTENDGGNGRLFASGSQYFYYLGD